MAVLWWSGGQLGNVESACPGQEAVTATQLRPVGGSGKKKVAPAGPGEMALEMFCVTGSTFTQILSNLQLLALLSRVVILALKWT